MVSVAYGVCVGSWERFTANVAPRTEGRPVIAVSGLSSIAAAYSTIQVAAQHLEADVLILQHDDLQIVDPDGEAKIVQAVDGGSALVGVAGGGSDAGIGWWSQTPVGRQQTDAGPIEFGARAGDVQCLEGSLIALGHWAIWHLRFDEAYPGFHGYDADITRQAITAGRRVTVIDLETWHHTQTGFKTNQSHRDWLAADGMFRTKWGLA